MAELRFSEAACKQLKYYVYLYIDPRDDVVFYVGKGVGNRCFSHLKSVGESDKAQRIADIHTAGTRPRIEILKYGLSEKEALLVEATAIDLLEIDNLTNSMRGHGSRVGSRAGVEQLIATLDPRPIDIAPGHSVVLININNTYSYGMSPVHLYDVTRSAWVVSLRSAERARYAMSVFRGVVREVYEIAQWLPDGSTFRSDDADRGRYTQPDRRYEFVGTLADEDIRRRYIDRSVAHYFPKGAQNPIKYVNCRDAQDDQPNKKAARKRRPRRSQAS